MPRARPAPLLTRRPVFISAPVSRRRVSAAHVEGTAGRTRRIRAARTVYDVRPLRDRRKRARLRVVRDRRGRVAKGQWGQAVVPLSARRRGRRVARAIARCTTVLLRRSRRAHPFHKKGDELRADGRKAGQPEIGVKRLVDVEEEPLGLALSTKASNPSLFNSELTLRFWPCGYAKNKLVGFFGSQLYRSGRPYSWNTS